MFEHSSGHEFKLCTKRPRTVKEELEKSRKEEELNNITKNAETEFQTQRRRKNVGNVQSNTNGKQKEVIGEQVKGKIASNGSRFDNRFTNRGTNRNQEYRKKQTDNEGAEKDKNKVGNSGSGK